PPLACVVSDRLTAPGNPGLHAGPVVPGRPHRQAGGANGENHARPAWSFGHLLLLGPAAPFPRRPRANLTGPRPSPRRGGSRKLDRRASVGAPATRDAPRPSEYVDA